MVHTFCTFKEAADRLGITEAAIEALLDEGVLREFRDGSSRLLKVADLAVLARTACWRRTNRSQAAASCDQTGRIARVKPRKHAYVGIMNERPPTRRHGGSYTEAQQHGPDSSRRDAPASETCGTEIKLPAAAVVLGQDTRDRSTSHQEPIPPAGSPSDFETTFARSSMDRIDEGRAWYGATGPAATQVRRGSTWPLSRRNRSRAEARSAFSARRPAGQASDGSLKEWIWTGLIDDRPHTILVLLGVTVLTACTLIAIGYVLTRIF